MEVLTVPRVMTLAVSVDESLAAKPDNTDYGILEKPLHRILREMAERPKLTHVVVHKGGIRIEMRR